MQALSANSQVVEKSAQPPYFVSFTKHLYNTKQTLVVYQLFLKQVSFPEQLNDKFVKLCEGHIYPSNQTHGGVTFLEIANWLVKRTIIIIVSG